jgi:hypothetical protein
MSAYIVFTRTKTIDQKEFEMRFILRLRQSLIRRNHHEQETRRKSSGRHGGVIAASGWPRQKRSCEKGLTFLSPLREGAVLHSS